MNTKKTKAFDIEEEITPTEYERFEAKITAYALGQLPEDEKAEVERLLADQSRTDLREHVAEIQSVAEVIRSTPDEEELSRSSDLRRMVLAAVTQPEPVRSRAVRYRWLVSVGAVAACVLVIIALPQAFEERRLEQKDVAFVAKDFDGSREEKRKSLLRGPDNALREQESASTRSRRVADTSPAVDLPASNLSDRRQLGRKSEPVKALNLSAAEEAAEGMGEDHPFAADASGQVEGQARVMASQSAALAPTDEAEQLGLNAVGGGVGGGAAALARNKPKKTQESDGLYFKRSAARSVPNSERYLHDEYGINDMERPQSSSGEGYAEIIENTGVSPKDHPLSTFSIDVDTASYANTRRFLQSRRLPPQDAVRIEELINYFQYDYPQPEGDTPFSVTVDAARCPWNSGHRLVRIGLQGQSIDRDARPVGNLVFLIDVSGSMQSSNKLPLVQQALGLLVDELTENDRVSIVTYAGRAGLVLAPTTGDQKQVIRDAIESLSAGGSTHGSAGINLAYEQAQEHFVDGGANRVILATDGDLNVGVTNTNNLKDLIAEKAKTGVFLTVLGFGEGNLQDEKMEALADHGNGIYGYIDGVREARKVFVEQLTGSTVTIAKDVKIQVEFNPTQVASYRLLGYENRALAARDFRDDKKDAGDIGAGHSVTALYEITLVGESDADEPGVEPLKYQAPVEEKETPTENLDPSVSRELLTVKLRWKKPDAVESSGFEVPFSDRGPSFDEASVDFRFASAVAAYGMILRNSGQKGDATYEMVSRIAGESLGQDDGGYRAEFLDLVRKAQNLQNR